MTAPNDRSLLHLPGGDLVEKGLRDLKHGNETEEALLVLVASPRLRDLGFEIRDLDHVELLYEHRLYEAIEERCPNDAHRTYNALIAKIVSFANCYQ